MLRNIRHILSLNTQGLRRLQKRRRLYEWLKDQKFDIAFLQKTHFTEDIIQKVNEAISKKNISN